ncbi:MAG: metallophosphoesterase [Vicinamibacteraceae bacterium]
MVKSSRRRFLWRGLGSAAVLATGTGLYAWRIEPHWIEFVERALPIANLPLALAGRTLVQLSDLHVGPRVDDDYIIAVFDRVRAMAPDIVAFTGDFTENDLGVPTHARHIYARAPLGRLATVGVFGNHDYGPGWRYPEFADALLPVLADCGIRVLRNEVVDVAGLDIVGLDDWWAKQFRPAAALAYRDPTKAGLVLSHNPDTADLPGWSGYAGWILCGHTHGGQCKPPFLPPPLIPVLNKRYTNGEIAVDGGRRLYISRGVGHTRMVRFNVRPEVTVFRLQRA